jgi:hypothetical protein
VLRMRRTDIQDGSLWVTQAKTGAKVRIAIVGPLADVGSKALVRSAAGNGCNPSEADAISDFRGILLVNDCPAPDLARPAPGAAGAGIA